MWISLAITLILFTNSNAVLSSNECESLRNCQQCIYAPSCSWYLEYRSSNGSGCFQTDKLDEYKKTKKGYSHPPKASFYIENEGNDEVIPSKVAVTIRVNEPFTFPVTFRPRKIWKEQIFELKYTTKNPIKINFYSNCSGQYEQLVETNQCENTKFNDSIVFLVKVEQKSCSKHQPEQIKTITINLYPSSAIFRLHLYTYCFCPCEMETRKDPQLPQIIPDCHNKGSFICGVCYCEDGFTGKNCEINTSNTIS